MVVLGWVLFRAADLSSAFDYIKAMFGAGGNKLIDDTFIFNAREYLAVIAAGLLCSTPLFAILKKKLAQKSERAADILGYGVQLVLFVISISFLIMNAHNPFIYFNF